MQQLGNACQNITNIYLPNKINRLYVRRSFT